MKLETFFDNFEVLAEAPNGVKKVRNLILHLAVQGKLVQKDDKDEPARILRDNMKTEKERLMKEKKIKRTDSLSSVKKEEVPFDIPKHWEWLRIGDAMNLINGVAFKPSEWSTSGLPIIRIQNLNNHNAPFNYCNFDIDEKFHVQDSDFLISWSGTPGTSFGAFIWNRCHAILNQHIFRAELFGSVFRKEFLKHAINARLDEMIAQAHGGVGLQHITKGKLENLCIPLPPLEEQNRIVVKVDQLNSLCDELEARQQKKRETRALINSAALDRLLTARAPGEFTEGWRRISDNFDLLYDAPENVGALRKAILQLAVMGKLVAQDEKDEPALVLMEKIKAEKERLIKEKKIKRTENLVEPSEVPFELPEGWNWVSMGNALLKVTDGTHHSPPNYETGDFKYVTAKNIKTQGIDLTNITYVSTAVHNEIYSRCNPESCDILYIKDGATTGIATINNITEPFSMLSSVALLKMPSAIYNRYMHYVLRSPFFYSLIRDDMSGVAITRVTLTKLNKALIPLPPFEEQRRIVAKVDQLMSLCDKLEVGLLRSQADSERLMEAVVGRMLTDGDSA